VLEALESSGSIDFTVFAQYGALGAIAIVLIFFAKGAYQDVRDRAKIAYQDVRDRADRLEEENRRLNALILDRVVPALTAATQIAEESGRMINALQREREIAHELEQQRRTTRGGER
jgi:hypothetical protein